MTKKICKIKGCREVAWNTYNRCELHQRQRWQDIGDTPNPDAYRGLYGPLQFEQGKELTIMFVDYVGGRILEVKGFATGNATEIPQEMDYGDFARLKRIWMGNGVVMALPLREDVTR